MQLLNDIWQLNIGQGRYWAKAPLIPGWISRPITEAHCHADPMGCLNLSDGITHKQDLSRFKLYGCGDGVVTSWCLFGADSGIKPVAE